MLIGLDRTCNLFKMYFFIIPRFLGMILTIVWRNECGTSNYQSVTNGRTDKRTESRGRNQHFQHTDTGSLHQWNLNSTDSTKLSLVRLQNVKTKYRCLWNTNQTNAPLPQTWPLTLTFNLLTWKSIGIIYSWSKTIYPPSLKLLGQSVLELSVAQGQGRLTYRPTDGPTCATQYAPPFSKGA